MRIVEVRARSSSRLLIFVGTLVCCVILFVFLRARHIARQVRQAELGHVLRPLAPEGRSIDEQVIRGIGRETELVQSVLLQLSLFLGLSTLFFQEFIESHRANRLDFFLEHGRDRVASVLQELDEVHDLLLAQLEVVCLVLQRLNQAFQLDVLPNEHV